MPIITVRHTFFGALQQGDRWCVYGDRQLGPLSAVALWSSKYRSIYLDISSKSGIECLSLPSSFSPSRGWVILVDFSKKDPLVALLPGPTLDHLTGVTGSTISCSIGLSLIVIHLPSHRTKNKKVMSGGWTAPLAAAQEKPKSSFDRSNSFAKIEEWKAVVWASGTSKLDRDCMMDKVKDLVKGAIVSMIQVYVLYRAKIITIYIFRPGIGIVLNKSWRGS